MSVSTCFKSHNTQIGWERLKYCLKEALFAELGREESVLSAYNSQNEKLTEMGISIDKYIRDNILGESGSTKETCYFVDKLVLQETVYDVYIQNQVEQFAMNKWLKDYWSTHGKSLAPACHDVLKEGKRNVIMITRNTFKYNLTKNIDHWLGWSNTQLDSKTLTHVAKMFFSEYDYIIHVNPDYNRSIPSVFHAHFFINCDKIV